MQTTPPPDPKDVRETGDAADGLVRAVVAGNRMESLQLDPRVMRMASQELAEHVVTAVNAALDAVSTRHVTVDEAVTTVDTRALAAEVAEIQDQSVRQIAAITQQINAAVARMRESLR